MDHALAQARAAKIGDLNDSVERAKKKDGKLILAGQSAAGLAYEREVSMSYFLRFLWCF